MDDSLLPPSRALRSAVSTASRGLIDREVLVELVILAAVANEHLLVLGPPGTAKSEAVRRVARALGGAYFEYLLGRFTEPSELFGPVDLLKLKQGVVETRTERMLPEAEIAFLDEVFLGSTAILNTLLALLNERRFRRGHTDVECPLRVCVGAANVLPQEDELAAFADRFLLRVFVDPIPDARLEELLAGGREIERAELGTTATMHDLELLRAAARSADLSEVTPALAHALRLLRKNGVTLSDRRAVKLQNLIAAAAVLDGRRRASGADLWSIVHAIPTREQQVLGRQVLSEILTESDSDALAHAAADASESPLARARLIEREARALLDDGSDPSNAWRLKLEAVAREIDASFAESALPPSLAAVRQEIVSRIAEADRR